MCRAGAATLVVAACRSKPDELPIVPRPPPVVPLSEPLADGVGLTGLPYPELAELSIAELADKLARRDLTSVALVQRYRERIAALDPTLHSILEVNREAEQIAERLENVRIDMGRRIARVSADFIFMDEEEQRPGKLGLHLAEGKEGWKIVAVLFAYDNE